MNYHLHEILTTPGRQYKNLKYGILIEIRNRIATHRYYFLQKIKLLNIPRCASTSLGQMVNKMNSIKHYKFMFIRNPEDRFKSTVYYTMVKHRTFAGSWPDRYSLADKLDFLKAIFQKNDNTDWCHADLLMHFIPQVFYIDCANRIDADPIDFTGIVDNTKDFEIIRSVTGTESIPTANSSVGYSNNEFNAVFPKWYAENESFIREYYAEDFAMYKKVQSLKNLD